MAAIWNFIVRWHNEGLLCTPPPCLYSRRCRSVLSESPCCLSFGRVGYKWADEYRSPIMFWAFWGSFVSIVLLIIPFLSLGSRTSTVQNCYWTKGKITNYKNAGMDIDVYCGLRYVSLECDGSQCPDSLRDTISWDDLEDKGFCTTEFCADCQSVVSKTITSAVLSLLTMLPQITTNLQRSKPDGDLHCQKAMGFLTSILGTVGTIITMVNYVNVCYSEVPTSGENEATGVHWMLGPSFWCTLVATFLKIGDAVVNLIVPVPEFGYWREKDAIPTTEIDNSMEMNAYKSVSPAPVDALLEDEGVKKHHEVGV